MKKDEIISKLLFVKSTVESLPSSENISDTCVCLSNLLKDIVNGIATSRFTNGKDLTGQTFGQLTVLGIHGKVPYSGSKWGYTYEWKCRCSCGNIVYRTTPSLLHQKTLLANMCSTCRGRVISLRHGGSKTGLYGIWTRMKQRCYDKNTPYYNACGGKGIIVCDEWVSDFPAFEEWAFTHGYKEGFRLKRRNTNDNFTPVNCYFDTPMQITINGETHTFSEWSRITGVNYATAQARKRAGVPQDLWFYKGNLTDRKQAQSK